MYRRLKRSLKKLSTTKAGAGLTITEAVMASVLLLVGITTVLKALTNAHFATIGVEHKTVSLTLAQAKLDEIRARSIYHYSDSFTESNTALSGSYLCNVTDDGADPLRTVTVSVGFDGDSSGTLESNEIEVALSTLIARRWTD
jgi:Tfp pilus assembly protein PilV